MSSPSTYTLSLVNGVHLFSFYTRKSPHYVSHIVKSLKFTFHEDLLSTAVRVFVRIRTYYLATCARFRVCDECNEEACGGGWEVDLISSTEEKSREVVMNDFPAPALIILGSA